MDLRSRAARPLDHPVPRRRIPGGAAVAHRALPRRPRRPAGTFHAVRFPTGRCGSETARPPHRACPKADVFAGGAVMTAATPAIADIYALAPMQQGMLFHTLYAPASGVYVEQMSCTLRGRLDPHAFRRAWAQLSDRHAALRTAFLWEEAD